MSVLVDARHVDTKFALSYLAVRHRKTTVNCFYCAAYFTISSVLPNHLQRHLKCNCPQLLSLAVVQLNLDSKHIARRRYFSTQNLFIPPTNLLDCQGLQIFLCEVTHCSSHPQDFFFEGPVYLWCTIAGPHLLKMERKQQAALTLTAADKQWGWGWSVWRLCKDLACFFSGGGQQCSKLVVPALLLAAIHTDTQFLPWCRLPDGKNMALLFQEV